MNSSAVPPLMRTPSAATPTTVQPATGRGRVQAVDRLDHDAADRDQQQPGIEQRRQDRGAAIAVGVALGRLPLRQPRRAPGQQQRHHVGEIVNGVRDQRQRVGGIAEDQLGDDEGGIERGADRKGRAETIRRMAVPGMAVGVAMRVGMIVMVVVVIVRHGAVIARGNWNTITAKMMP